MKKLSETLTELGIAFSFPINIKDDNDNETYYEDRHGFWFKREYDANGNETYYESSTGFWAKREYDAKGNRTYYESSTGYWSKHEYDAKGNRTYYENSTGVKRGTSRSKPCDGKVVEVDGIKYKLTAV